MKRLFALLFVSLASGLRIFAQVTQEPAPQTQPQPANPTPDIKLRTTVTVNGTLREQTPVPVTVWPEQQIEETPGTELDDRLRQFAGFSLFRRTSSVVANPTTQGVSLRGIGSSGASRTLVLWDGIPINDPFGGWVYWDRLDPYDMDRIEVEPGAPISVFGDRAMSGTISMFSQPEKRDYADIDVFGGNDGTVDVSGAYSNLWGHWGLSLHARDLTTDGYYIVPSSLRGRVDTKANVRFATSGMNLDYLGAADRLSIHFDILAEERQNGTRLTHNSTGLGTVGANYTHSWTNDEVSILGFHTREQFHSTFSSVSLNRNSETLTSRQTVPAEELGGAAYWQHHQKRWNTLAGADTEDIHGTSYDYSYSTRVLTPSGGTLLQHGLFTQADFKIGPARFFGGVRHQFTGQHGDTFVSGNGGVAVGVRRFRLRASGYRSFRAPSLNELYRSFRVGNVLTEANPGLVPENLIGVETGADWSSEKTRIALSLFHYDLNDLIDNATLRITPTLILRQRQNFPSALSRGLESNLNHRWRNWNFNAGYLFADARLSSGARIPQVPKQQGTAQLTYSRPATLISFGIRSYGLQFDDDLNQFKLPGFAALSAMAEQHIAHGISAVASVENLLDRTYLVALTPFPNTGSPRLWRVGLKWGGQIR
ncbi:MAG: TonB-dependent receptor [Acidobacteriaceae bacterium]|nr:TonB-dependent receptor [Acidobacteriaceae bacterium]